MQKLTSVSIILPVLNEEENLPLLSYLLFKTGQESSLSLSLIVVEDNSSDRTRTIALRLKEFYKDKFEVIFRANQRGLGTAYRDALPHVMGDYVVIMDSDLSHHPKYIPRMLKKMINEKLDIVFSSRYCNEGGVVGWPFMRKVNSRCANFIACQSLGIYASDFTGSFRMFTRDSFEKILSRTASWGFGCQMEVLVLAHLHGLKIGSIPIVFVERIFGSSKLSIKEIKQYLLTIIDLSLLPRKILGSGAF